MTRKLNRNYSLSVVVPFIGILILLIAAAVLAQTSGAGQTSGKEAAVLATAGTTVSAQAERPLVPWMNGAGRSPVGDSHTKHGTRTTDQEYPFSLVPAVTYDSGGEATMSLAVADVNGDGKPDVITANLDNGTVGVLLGNGDGTFQPAVIYGAGATPASIAVADFNGDGIPDLVVANRDSNTVSVLLGNGDGTFQPAVSSPAGPYPIWVAVGDFNGDGKQDLVVTIQYDGECPVGEVSVLLGNGDGTFQAPVGYGSGGVCTSTVAVADVNRDGKLDLVVSNLCPSLAGCPYSEDVGVLLGNGDGTFQPAVSYDLGGGANGGATTSNTVAVADVNGDGKPDLVVANVCTNPNCNYVTMAVLLGNGDGTFQPAVLYFSEGSYGLVIADVNGDGKPDLLAANAYGGSVVVLLGNGDGTFQSPLFYSPGGAWPYQVAVADVNGDGWPDVLVANSCWGCYQTDGSVGVLLNNSGAPTTTTTLVSSLNPASPKKVVTYTATVTAENGGALTGSITFQDGGSTIATVPLTNNQAAYSTTYKKGGSHAITATYSGNIQDQGSTSALTEYIESVVTKTNVTTSGSPSQINQPVTFTATVSSKQGPIPNGELVTFYDGKTEIGTGTTASGVATFTTSSLKAKTHVIKAKYPGDDTFEPSTGSVKQVVEK